MGQLLDLVSASVVLKKRGRDHWAPCPFHNEKTSSFKVGTYKGKERYHCFGCGARGDATDWLIQTRGLTFQEARRELGEPVRPEPAILEARRQTAWRDHVLRKYRDDHPECECPDWLIAIPTCPHAYRTPPAPPEPRTFTTEEFDRIYAATWATET
jgi:CHC2-type zinc finger protein